jgi:hypothetical protein
MPAPSDPRLEQERFVAMLLGENVNVPYGHPLADAPASGEEP